MALLPVLNCLTYGYSTAMPRGFFNQEKFAQTQMSSINAKTKELSGIYAPIIADRIQAAADLMKETDTLSGYLSTEVPKHPVNSLSEYAKWEAASYDIAKGNLFHDDAARLMYLLGYDTGSFFGNLSFLIVVLDFCLEGESDNFILAKQFMLEQVKLYNRIKDYSTTLWMMPKPPIYTVEDIFFKQGLEPAYATILTAAPQSREEWDIVFKQMKAASMLLDQQFGALIKALMK